jgi:signal recognition particle subunit SRP54
LKTKNAFKFTKDMQKITMVLAELSQSITGALKKLSNNSNVSQEMINDMLKEICNALIAADVNIKMVLQLRANISKHLNVETMAAGLDKQKTAKKVVFDELVKLLDAGIKAWKPQRGKSNVIMLVGLQGSGKTTTVTKLASWYKRQKWRPSLVCADTFRAGAYDQLCQNATRANVPFYGSHSERDPVKIAKDGVNKFKEIGNDIIIVDTSGRNKQDAALFEEMQQIVAVIEPDQIVFVMDGTIGQSAYDQALVFKEMVDIGGCIITKLDGHAKGGGALSAVAATKSPIIFIGTGEGPTDFQEFDAKAFVSRLLGIGDAKGMVNIIQNAVPKDAQPKMTKRLQEGKFSLRDMYEQYQILLKMGPLDQIIDMFPDTGLDHLLKDGGCEAGHQKIKNYITIMDSMTDQELDFPKVLNQSRVERIARGSGRSLKEVQELLAQFKQFEKVVSKMKGTRRGSANQMQNFIHPQLLKQMGGAGSLNTFIRQMETIESKTGFK